MDLSAWPEVAIVVDGVAGGTSLAPSVSAGRVRAKLLQRCDLRELKLLTRRAYLKDRPRNRWPGSKRSERIRIPVHTCNSLGRTSRARTGLQNAS
jgi:hypothetical protein